MSTEVPAVAAAVRILERLASAAPSAVSPGVLVNELGMNRSTCYNILATLQKSGWALNLGERAGWTLGPRLLGIGRLADEVTAATTRQELQRLSRELGFVAFVAERTSAGPYVVVAKAERQKGVRVTVDVGDTFPWAAPALMHAFHAWAPEEERTRALERHDVTAFTEHTVVEPGKLRQVFAQVRRDGFSRSLRQFDLSQGAAAAPIFDQHGRVTRVVCVLAFSSELDESNIDAVGHAVRHCADRIAGRTVGGPPQEETKEGVAS